jgi:hypothetical protein
MYIDGILVYSRTIEEHTQHFKELLRKLRDNKLYANGVKKE